MSKSKKPTGVKLPTMRLTLDADEILDRFSPGMWVPNVDICETSGTITIRIELPGVEHPDIKLSLRDNVLRVRGAKKEPLLRQRVLGYHCLERRYGRFDRQISIDCVIDSGRSRSFLSNGILTIEIPKLQDRRHRVYAIPITVKQKRNSS